MNTVIRVQIQIPQMKISKMVQKAFSSEYDDDAAAG